MRRVGRLPIAIMFGATLVVAAPYTSCYALSYAMAPLGPRDWIGSAGYAISASGVVGGVGGDMEPPAIFFGGAPYYQILGPAGTWDGSAYGVIGSTLSDVQVVGQFTSYNGMVPFLFHNGATSLLTFPGMSIQDQNLWGAAQGINRSGEVVGWVYSTDESQNWKGGAFLYHDGAMTNLDPNGFAYGINDSGQIAGRFSGGYMYSNGQSSTPGQFPGVTGYVGRAINSHGDIAGSARFPDGDHAFAYVGGHMIDFGLGTAEGINSNGEVVGMLWDATHTFQHAFLYTGLETDRVYTLASLVPNDNSTGPFDILDASAINDAGQISGEARFLDYGGAFVMTPAPEPQAAGLMASALAVLTLFVVRRRSQRRPVTSAHPR